MAVPSLRGLAGDTGELALDLIERRLLASITELGGRSRDLAIELAQAIVSLLRRQ